jgi:hypothetical protein
MASAVITLTSVRPNTTVKFFDDYLFSTTDESAVAFKPLLNAASTMTVINSQKFVPNFDRSVSKDGLTTSATCHVADISEIDGLSADSTSAEILELMNLEKNNLANSVDPSGQLANYFNFRRQYNADNNIVSSASIVVTA